MTDEHASGGLRERQRIALRHTIERAAIDLASEHGYEKVTVEMICDASMTSPRTFFNYFGSKEGVILGPALALPSEQVIDSFVNEPKSDILAEFISMAANALVEEGWDQELTLARQAIIQQSPELTAKRTGQISELEEQYVAVIVARLAAQGRDANDPSVEDEARMLVAFSGGVIGFTRRKWVSGTYTGEPTELLDYSIGLVRRVASAV